MLWRVEFKFVHKHMHTCMYTCRYTLVSLPLCAGDCPSCIQLGIQWHVCVNSNNIAVTCLQDLMSPEDSFEDEIELDSKRDMLK